MAKKPEMVVVHWRDITAAAKTWQQIKKVRPDERQVVSVGWLVYQDDRSIVLAQDWDESERNVSGVATYPVGACDSVHVIEL